MKKKAIIIISGVSLLLAGLISMPYWFIYTTLINSNFAPLGILCVACIIWGIQLLVKASKIKFLDGEAIEIKE